MAYDNICKYLAEEYPTEFARWLLAEEITDIQVLKTEMSVQLQERVQGLFIPLLEELSLALLDFEAVTDLVTWLDEHQPQE